MGQLAPGATIVIPTFRRAAGLGVLLERLAALRDPETPWDVVVVDNDDPPGAGPVYTRHASDLPEGSRYLRETARGSAYARNAGIGSVDRELTVLCDDDVIPDREWLARLLEPILSGRCEGTGGRVLLDPEVMRPRWFDEASLGGYLAAWDLADDERDLAPGEIVVSSNCAYRTDILKRTGGFDPALGPRGKTPLVNDDALVTRRFQEMGGRVRFVPRAVVVHELPPDRLNRRYLLRRAYLHGRSDWILDRDLVAAGRAKGAGSALRALRRELALRREEGLRDPAVAFHAACDIARSAGSLREALKLLVTRRRLRE
jgi:glucosyl-dolichyl phosphate glucuronosyltransferase